jgi:hypothetical protein
MAAELEVTKPQELERRALDWALKAGRIKITNQSTYDEGTEMHKGILALLDEIDGVFDPGIGDANKLHKGLIAMKKKVQGTLPTGEQILRTMIGAWEQAQERIRQEAERKAQEEARKREEEARLALAVQAEQAGATEETVEEIIATPLPAPVLVAAPTFQRAEGYSKPVERWKAELVDIKALCRAVAEGKASTEFVQANLPALNSLARAMKGTFNIPGCKAVIDTSISVRR